MRSSGLFTDIKILSGGGSRIKVVLPDFGGLIQCILSRVAPKKPSDNDGSNSRSQIDMASVPNLYPTDVLDGQIGSR